MINEIVYHKTKGKGTIVDVNPNESNIYITVAFENEKLEFNFPNAFESFLEAESDELNVKVNEALAEKQKKKDEEERKKQYRPWSLCAYHAQDFCIEYFVSYSITFFSF